MIERGKVFAAISEERRYQESEWPTDNKPLTVGEELLLLEEYVQIAREAWATQHKPEYEAIGIVRKVAAIACRCMEHNGIIHRYPKEA